MTVVVISKSDISVSTTDKGYHSYSIMRSIKEIVESNRDIKVWNLSLGSAREINPNFISPEAALLDKLQCQYDIVFVVAGTNKPEGINKEMIIGSPADSINSIVVNAVNSSNQVASYSRHGRVLSFFNKPDVAARGGDQEINEIDSIRVCTPAGIEWRSGTSFAAPWITRKVAYLIEILGLSRETAKALIVDAATGWRDTGNDPRLAPLIGHGSVPQKIEQITQSPNEEIKFIIEGVSNKWDTYTYRLPVPIYKDKHPFVAKATLCYFPECSIKQGVDYTNTELDIYLGRLADFKVKTDSGQYRWKRQIKPINKNRQSLDDQNHYLYEGSARNFYRKWDNTKHIKESHPAKPRARKAYSSSMWGVSLKRKERLEVKELNALKFSLVITIKEIDGINRINDFIHACGLQGWQVNEIDLKTSIDIYNNLQKNISLDS